MERAYAYAVSAVVLAAVAWPGTWDLRRDSFPLTPYQMFSRDVSRNPRVAIPQAMGVNAAGERATVPMRYVANEEILQAHYTLDRAVAGGREAQLALCRYVAGEIERANDANVRDVVAVEIATYTYDAVAYFVDAREPLATRVHVSCPVAR